MHFTHTMTRRALQLTGLAAILCAAVPAVQAQDKPSLKILVGFAPGGSADVLARLIAEAIRDDFSTIIIDNKPGAGGRIALNAVKSAKPDGQTVIVLPSGPMVLFPHV
jgi:tripartite-type tricarboxylate transporter receptor subunit TctC